VGVREQLAGQRVLLTGVTGFVGHGVFERFLRSVPGADLVLLVRPKDGRTGRERVHAMLTTGAAFGPLREEFGEDGVERLLDERVEILEGDVEDAPDLLPDDLDTVIHCAGNVSFDPPIDEAFRTNLLGATALYEAVRARGRAHVVHVSTAYVAGVTKGVVPEAPLEHAIDWRTEADAALAHRRQIEQASRRPQLLDRLMDEAHDEHSRAGPQAVAAAAEEARRSWVDEQLVEHGRARARSLGWPDVYTLTKALAERATEEICAEVPLSIVRPSIIESALAHPHPGWIEGFKMAEPIILGYGRGAFPDFPGVPDGIVDIIPVDLVVNALITVAADPPPAAADRHLHVCSGSRNPLRFRELYEHVRDYFLADPLPDRDGGTIPVPEWRFRGVNRIRRMLSTGEKLVEVADSVVERLPRSDRARDAAREVHRRRKRLEFVRRYADLYGPYVEAEVIYTDDRMMELHRRLDEADREEFEFDATVVDWRHYLQDVHCPAVTALMRVGHQRGSSAGKGNGSGNAQLSRRADVVAAFDMDGTIISTNVVESYLWLRMADEPDGGWTAEAAAVARDLPRYLAAERRAREEFLRTFYRRYAGASLPGLRRLVDEEVGEHLLRRVSPRALRRIRAHRAAGHHTVLITGAVEVLTAPLAPLFDEIVAAELACDDEGICDGFLTRPPLVGEARAAWLQRYADRLALDLDASYAYADSHSDLPLLEAVGHPVAVNPDVTLYGTAKQRRWDVERWSAPGGTPRLLVPGRRA
jgi:alcohol-forming fatty acyl-CoA reductase